MDRRYSQNCKSYRSGYRHRFLSAANCVVRNNEAWEDRPDYDPGCADLFGAIARGFWLRPTLSTIP